MEQSQIHVSDGPLSVTTRPGNPMFFFLHGLAGHSKEWEPVIARLNPMCGIINLDQRAHAASWAAGTRAVSRSLYISDAISVIERFAANSVIVVGQSMGGIVATLLAHARPDLVSHLVLVEAGMETMTEDDLSRLKMRLDRWPEIFASEAEAVDFFGKGKRSTAAWIEGLSTTSQGLTRRFDSLAMVQTMRELASAHRWSEWQSLDCPVSIVAAGKSMLSETDLAEMLRTRPAAELLIVGNAGHDVHLDAPEALADLLLTISARKKQLPNKNERTHDTQTND